MTRYTLATQLAHRIAGDRATSALIGDIVNDDELIELARQDMDAAAQLLIDFAIDTVSAHVAIHRDTNREAA